MNTKSLLLFALFLLVFPQSVSVGANTKSQLQHTININVVDNSKSDNHNNDPWNMNLELPNNTRNHKANDDDDGKSHHFHFERLHHRNKLLFSLLGKFVLLFAHISSLVMAFMQCLH